MTHSLYIVDPNGYGVEVLYELPREVWGDNIQGAHRLRRAGADRRRRGLHRRHELPDVRTAEKAAE